MFGRRNIATLVAEFLGTGALTLLVLSVQRSTIGVPFFVAAAAGLIVALMSFALAGASGAYFNPAITLGMWTARKIATIKAVAYIAAQLLGALAASALYVYLVNNKLQQVGGHYTGRILTAEAVGTGIFGFAFAAVSIQGFSRAVSASFVGLGLMLGIIAASPAAIGLLNPAVALGAHAWVWGTYVLGPVLGAVIGINLYGMLFAAPEKLVVAASTSSTNIGVGAVVKKAVGKKKTAKKSKK
ncbi:MAG: aquaporin [Candidatus Saccharimonadales bacterium]